MQRKKSWHQKKVDLKTRVAFWAIDQVGKEMHMRIDKTTNFVGICTKCEPVVMEKSKPFVKIAFLIYNVTLKAKSGFEHHFTVEIR